MYWLHPDHQKLFHCYFIFFCLSSSFLSTRLMLDDWTLLSLIKGLTVLWNFSTLYIWIKLFPLFLVQLTVKVFLFFISYSIFICSIFEKLSFKFQPFIMAFLKVLFIYGVSFSLKTFVFKEACLYNTFKNSFSKDS